MDEFILWLGQNLSNFEYRTFIDEFLEQNEVNGSEWSYVNAALLREGLTSNATKPKPGTLGPHLPVFGLTPKGWDRFYELQKKPTNSKTAFMAMQFGNPKNGGKDYIVERALRECFAPAVEATGFTLKKVTQNQPAGLIDDHIIVGIRTAKFLIVDCTDSNLGAYWEAGFAEALQTPVIYTCREEWFPNRHFDIEHKKTIKWNENDWAPAIQEIKDTIRATFPNEAIMEDFTRAPLPLLEPAKEQLN